MPAWETLLIVQCHHVRGRAASGGERNPLSNASPGPCARNPATVNKTKENHATRRLDRGEKIMTGENKDSATASPATRC